MVPCALLSLFHLASASCSPKGLYLPVGKHSCYLHFFMGERTGTQVGSVT